MTFSIKSPTERHPFFTVLSTDEHGCSDDLNRGEPCATVAECRQFVRELLGQRCISEDDAQDLLTALSYLD